jgi:hypothetical protein
LKTLAALAAMAVVSCTGSPQSNASPSPVISASPTGSNAAASKAADFRIRLDLLLGEHVIIIAKQSSAPARQAEYASYLRLLTTNGADLRELLRSAMGDSVAARFDQIWSAQNDDLVSYTIGQVTHDKAKADAAMASITGTFIPQFSQFLSDVTQIQTSLITQLLTRNMLEMRQMLNDQAAQNYTGLYADIRSSYAHAFEVGDTLAPQIVGRFPDKFPGDVVGRAANLRVFLNLNWEEYSYLSTMRTSAVIGRRRAEQAAATGALANNASAIEAVLTGLFDAPSALQFDHIWAAGSAATISYASASTATAKQRALSVLTDTFITQLSSWLVDSIGVTADTSQPALETQLEALVTVIDDQRSKSGSTLAADDRSAGASSEVVADLIAAAAIAKLPPAIPGG